MTPWAYVFWHWPAETDGYEAGVIAFHGALRRAAVPGTLATASYRVEGLSWLPDRRGYEDWYLVQDLAALELLNETAVGPSLRPAHDRPALAVAGGTAALYALKSGAPDLDAPVVSWLAKPIGVPYQDFYASLPRLPCLFQRQLALGPGHEFVVLGDLPRSHQSHRMRLV